MKPADVHRISVPFFVTALSIVVLHLLFHPVRVLGMPKSIFYMDEKYTLAAFFTTGVAFLTGFLFLIRPRRHITDIATGIFFFVLALDEYFELHEYTNTMVKSFLSSDSLLGSLAQLSWLFPLSVVVVGIFVLLIQKIIRERDPLSKRSMMAGVGCFAVVLLFEFLGSLTYGMPIYVIEIAIEEGLEMIGVCFFLQAALVPFVSLRKSQAS